MGHWQQLEGAQRLIERLATIALRAQRLLVIQRINQLESMVKIHAPALKREPGGEEKLQAMYALCDKTRKALKEKPDG